MKIVIVFALMALASAGWADKATKQSALLEKKLIHIETMTDEMQSADEEFTAALQSVEPANRGAMCHMLKGLADTIKSDIKKLKKDVGHLEKKKNYVLLSEQQIIRLHQQESFLEKFSLVTCVDH